MTFKEALKILNIEDYGERIFKSNSRGELFHLQDYIILAKFSKENNIEDKFREVFEIAVEEAYKNWDRPNSIYQHILKILVGER